MSKMGIELRWLICVRTISILFPPPLSTQTLSSGKVEMWSINAYKEVQNEKEWKYIISYEC